MRQALSRFATQSESVSLTDCIVMAVADDYETLDSFGFDEAFRKNGYRILPKATRRRAP
jgi:predicted nucleic acid-binding protein